MADDIKTVNLNQFQKNFFQHINELRLENLFCDVHFNVNGKIIPCHRIVLATYSPYFKTMFNGNFKESNSDPITMNDIETEAFEEILSSMYTASIRFSPTNAFFILKASHLLQLEIVEDSCASYIANTCKISYLIETCVFAKNIERIGLYYACVGTIVNEIIEYGKTDSFMEIPIDIFNKILLRRGAVFNDKLQQESLLLLIMKWCRQNEASNTDVLLLLESADLKITKYLNPWLMAEFVSTYDVERISDANGENCQETDHIDFNLPLKLYLNAINVKTGQQGWTILKMNDEMNKYDVSSIYLTNSHYKKVCKLGSKLYCFEYFEYPEEKNVFSCYDEDNKRIFLPSPERKISQFEMFAMGTSIYVMSKERRQFTVWLYDIEQNTWLNIVKKNTHATIYCKVSACTFSDGVFYIIADKYNPDIELIGEKNKHLYAINCRSLVVTRISIIPCYFSKFSFICVFGQKIVLSDTWFEGDKHMSKTFMIYDKETKQWLDDSKSVKVGRVNFNLFHFNGFIYTVENGRAKVPNEKYDLRSNKWINLPSLPKQLTHANTNVIMATGEVFGVEIH